MKIIRVPKGESFRSRLIAMGACDDALAWVGRKSLRTAWRTCDRGDWMLWLAGRVDIDRRVLVLAACDCARLALPNARGTEALAAIETAEAWCRGESTIEHVRAAANAAAKAAYSAANAAAYADANAAYADANAAYAAANAAYSAANAAAYAADANADAYASTLLECAALVRNQITAEMIESKIKKAGTK